MNFISDEQVESALNYLRDNSAEYGRLRGLVKSLDHHRKIARGQAFLDSKEKTASAKTADAESSDEYVAIVSAINDAETELATLQTLMKAAELKIEVWRSLNSRRNKGHL